MAAKRSPAAVGAHAVVTVSGALLAVVLLLAPTRAALDSAASCSDCTRTAVLQQLANVHAPHYEKQGEAWNQCMQEQLGSYRTFDADDPRVKQAMARCAHLVPEGADVMHPSSVLSKLVSILTGPCFRVVRGEAGGPSEYAFRGRFDAGVTGEKNTRGQDIRSRLTLELYYNGDPVELVRSWTTESPLPEARTHYGRMFDNADAAIRRDLPVEDLLRDFERRPRTCEVDLGSAGEITPGEQVEVKLTGLRDERGRASKPFTRVVVEVERGRITSGARLAASPDRRAFRVGNGTVTFAYQAPDNCASSQDRLLVYSSCSILDPVKDPMEMTGVEKRIAEKTIPLSCPDLVAEYVSTFERHIDEPQRNGKGRETYISRIRATYRLRRTSTTQGEIEERYRLLSSTLTSTSGNGTYSAHYYAGDTEHTINSHFTVARGTIDTDGVGLSIIYDAGSGSVRRVMLDIFGVAFNQDGESTETIKYPSGLVRTRTTPAGLVPVLLPVVSAVPEFERASGSREGGVIAGGGTHAFPASARGQQKLTVTYALHKRK